MDSEELSITRSPGQSSEIYLTISKPAVVFACQVNQSFDSLDGVAQLTYDNATGTYSNVLAGMTCRVGSSAGLDDLGRVRIRKPATSELLYINQTSEIAFADNVHLTVVVDFGLWSREPLGDNMDYDILFSSATWAAPVPILGPIAKVLERTGATVSHTRDASQSYSPIGLDLTYQWYAPGASATSGMTTATPTITYNANGEYLEYCVVTDIVGAQSVGYRKVFVNPTAATIVFDRFSGDVDRGGWACSVTGYSGVAKNDLSDGALAVVWTRDYVGDQAVQLGSLPGYENILMIGWVDGESIVWDRNNGSFDFGIFGPAEWLQKINGAPMFVQDTDEGISTSWSDIANLTVDLALFRFIHFQTTIDQVMDVFPTGDTRRIHFVNVNSDFLWEQITWIAESKIMAKPLVNRYGQMYIETPVWLLPSAERGDVPSVIDLTSSDWLADGFEIERVTAPGAGMVELSGTSTWDGSGDTQLFSRAPGTAPGRFGEPMAPYSELVTDNQEQLNQMAGDWLAHENNEYPAVEIPLAYNLRYVDICPRQVVRASVDAGDTPRGIAWSNKRLIPLAVEFRLIGGSGSILTELVCEAETQGRAGVTYYPPQPPEINWDDSDGSISFPPIDTSPIIPGTETWIPGIIDQPPITNGCGNMAPANSYGISFSPREISGLEDELSSFSYYPCKLRPSSAFYGGTRITVQILYNYYGDALGKVSAYAIDASRNRIATLNVSAPMAGDNWTRTTLTYSGVGELDVAGFEIVLQAGGDIESFELGAVVGSGSIPVTSSAGVAIPVTAGQYYALQNAGGPWFPGGDFPTRRAWTMTFGLSSGSWVDSMGASEFSSFPVINYSNASSAYFGERVGAYYGRAYMQATGDNLYARVGDILFDDNTGSLSYVLRNATPIAARRIKIGAATIYNVCTAGTS